MIRVDNYVGDLELDLHDGLPRTTKDDPASHGYGLTTMRQVAERLGGSLTVRVEDGWFTVRVLLALEATPGGAA
jgi:signal transduction histidine kinase